MNDDDPIAHLDFKPDAPQCECCSQRCEQHPSGVRCAHTAMFHSRVHAFGFCKSLGLDRGFAVHIVCAQCMAHAARTVERLIAASHTCREQRGAHLVCTSCGLTLVNVHDVWEARELTDVI